MANPFFEPGEQRSAKVKELFALIAPRYDLLNDVMSLGLHRFWKRRLVNLAQPRPGKAALDLCCGTGDIAFALARRGMKVTGLDFSEAMLNIARHKAQRSADWPEGRPDFRQGDAQQLPFADNSFEVVTVGYGLRNLASWEAGISEMRRVAEPRGRLLVLDFGKPDNRAWRAMYFGYLRVFVPLLGLAFCGNAGAYAYILESLRHYPGQRGVADCMRKLGLGNVRIISILGGVMTINYGEKL